MANLTATIITLNEEKKITRCLESLTGLASEIILVDSGSSDRTLEIAKKFGAKVFEKKFEDFASQKNYASGKASCEWILSIDADEVIPENLKNEIKEAIKKNEFDGFLIPRRNFILGAEIKHSRWSPDKHIWLFKKDRGHWKGEVHEEVVVEGAIGELNNAKLHYQDESIIDFVKGNDFYAEILARDMYKRKIRFSIIRCFYDPLLEFFIRYVYKKGFLDGWRGLVLSLLMAYYKITVWLKLLNLQTKK